MRPAATVSGTVTSSVLLPVASTTVRSMSPPIAQNVLIAPTCAAGEYNAGGLPRQHASKGSLHTPGQAGRSPGDGALGVAQYSVSNLDLVTVPHHMVSNGTAVDGHRCPWSRRQGPSASLVVHLRVELRYGRVLEYEQLAVWR